MDEFDLIAKLFAPLSGGAAGAFGLTDDAAVLKAEGDLVLTKDAIVESVHFLADDPPATVARKLVRVNVSDLAAKGARPLGCLLAAILPADRPLAWLEAFRDGLAADLALYGMPLLGGDTVSTPGPIAFSLTVLGRAPEQGMPRRADARPGDDVWVTGTIGDAGLGLRALTEGLAGDVAAVVARYRVPEPRLDFGIGLAGLAGRGATIDVSDGLVADAGHIAATSGVCLALRLGDVPLSAAAAALVTERISLVTAGDDYEILFTARASARGAIETLASGTGTRVTRIGTVGEGEGVRLLGADGLPVTLGRRGWSHF